MNKENLNTAFRLSILGFILGIPTIILAYKWDVSKAKQNQQEPKIEQVTEAPVADTTKIETKRDTVLVLDYKPRAKHSYSTTYATNKFGYVYKINDPKNLPVERGDEIVIDVHKHTAPNGDTRTEYELVKNMTTEKLKQEYMKKH